MDTFVREGPARKGKAGATGFEDSDIRNIEAHR